MNMFSHQIENKYVLKMCFFLMLFYLYFWKLKSLCLILSEPSLKSDSEILDTTVLAILPVILFQTKWVMAAWQSLF